MDFQISNTTFNSFKYYKSKPLTQNIAPINSIIPQKEIMDSEIFQTTGNCTIDECEAQEEGDFFDHTDFIGLSEVRGYYHRYESEDFGTPVTCDGFVISEENNQFTIRLRNFITKEKLYLKDRLTFDNKLIMNIEMDFLDQPLKKKIISSSETKQVELRFMAPMLIPRGVSTCFSSVNILSVK